MAYSEFIEIFSKIRTDLYKHNFWETNNSRQNSSDSFGPTPLDEQTAWLAVYENIGEAANDIYSIFYKPLILTYAACYLLLRSGSEVLDLVSELVYFASKGFRSLVGLLPAPHSDMASENDENTSKDKSLEDMSAKALTGLCCVVGATLLAGVYLPIDTLCSIISVILRPFATLGVAFSHYCSTHAAC